MTYKTESHGSYFKIFEARNPRRWWNVFLTKDGWDVIDGQICERIVPDDKLCRAISRAFSKLSIRREAR